MTNKIKKGYFSLFLHFVLATLIFSVPFILLGFNYFILALTLIMIYYLINLWCFYQNFIHTSDVSNKVSWAIFLLFFPGFGSYLYFLGAYVKKNNWKKIKESGLLENGELLKQNIISNSSVEVIDGFKNKFNLLLEDIKKAKKEINIQYFIINDGIIWNNLKELLIKKHKDGIKIRILIDYMGNVQTNDSAYKEIIDAGIEFAVFEPIKFLKFNGTNNFRSHNKFLIIDNYISYIGGINLGDDYYSMYKKYGKWLDLSMRLKGTASMHFNNLFSFQWNNVTNQKIFYSKNTPNKVKKTKLTIESDGPQQDSNLFLNRLLINIRCAKESVKFVTPYFIIPESIMRELSDAVSRGVDVEIITAGRADKKSAYLIGKYFVEEAVSRGVKFYRTKNIFVHSKFYLFDDKKIISGTSNLDYRAIYYHFETNLIIEDENINKDFQKVFAEYKSHSHKIAKNSNNWTIFNRAMFLILKLFSPMF